MKKQMLNKKGNGGITLIALVITIVVLLILAGVSIVTLTGENGILKQTENSAEVYDMSAIKERAELVKTDMIIENNNDRDKLNRGELTQKLLTEFENSVQQGYSAIVENGEYIIEVDKDLEINVYKYNGKILEDGEVGLYIKEYTTQKNLDIARIDVEVQVGGIVPYQYYVTELLKNKTREEKDQYIIDELGYIVQILSPGEEISVKNILKLLTKKEYENVDDYFALLGCKNIDEFLINFISIESQEYTNKKVDIMLGNEKITVSLLYPTAKFMISHNGTYKVSASYEGVTSSQSIEISNIKYKKMYELEKENENIYLIKNVEDLVGFQENINQYMDTYKGKTVKLANNIDFNDDNSYNNPNDKSFGDINQNGIIEPIKKELTTGSGFRAIGLGYAKNEIIDLYVDSRFLGNFDGNNKTIKNLYMKSTTTTNNQHVGIFGGLQGNTVQDLTVTGDIIIEAGIEEGYVSSGAIAGVFQNGTIKNCNSYVNIKVTNNVNNYIGGLIGQGSSISVENSNNYGDVIVKKVEGYSEVDANCGGIAGYLAGYGTESIKLCNNYGDVQLITENGLEYYRAYIGGIVGMANSKKIEKCYNKGNLSNFSAGKYIYVAGISGYAGDGQVNECVNEGTIKNQGKVIIDGGSAQAGGIVASNTEGTGNTGNIINNCYNKGEIINNAEGARRAGGIAAYCSLSSKVNNSYNIKNIQIGKNELTENDNIGSVVGSLQGSAKNCYYLENTYNQGNSNGKEGTTVKTAEEMKEIEFLNLLNNENTNIWKLVENKNEGYPILNWQN